MKKSKQAKTQQHKNSNGKKKVSSVFARILWKIFGLLPAPVTFILVTFYLLKYVNISLYDSMVIASIVAVLVNILTFLKSSFLTIFTLAIPELVGRILRIYIVQEAVQYSPLPQIQTNMKVFLRAYTCTYEVALEASGKSSAGLMQATVNIVRRLVSSLNEVSDKIQAIFSTVIDILYIPLDHVKRWLDEVHNFNYKCSSSIGDAYRSCSSHVPGLKQVCRETVGIFDSSACSSLSNNINPCEVLNTNTINVCSAFSHIVEPRKYINDLKRLMEESKSHFKFRLDLNSKFKSNVSSDSIDNIRSEFEQRIDDFEPLKDIKALFNYLIIFTLLYMIISKSILVWKYNKGKSVKCQKISKLFLATNPMTIQFVILFVLALIDGGIRKIFELQKNAFRKHSISVSSKFSARVDRSGGEVGRLLADAISGSFGMSDSMSQTVNIGDCYKEEMAEPLYSSYAYVAIGLFLGFLTYAVDITCRKYQENVIVFAKNSFRRMRPERKSPTKNRCAIVATGKSENSQTTGI